MNVVLFSEEKLGGGPPRADSVIPFKDFVSDNALMDLGFSGYPFTWKNNQEGSRRVEVRLDRVLCSTSWFSTFSNARVIHELPIESDHSPLIVELEGLKQRVKSPFRFDTRWLKREECHDIVNRIWEEEGNCEEKMSKCEKELRIWAKQVFQDQNKRADEIQRRLEEILLLERTEEIINEEKLLMNELAIIWKDEELFWSQRSRISWLNEGDRNTNFFHSSTIHRKQRNKIVRLIDENGGVISQPEDINSHVKEYYKTLFTKSEGRDLSALQDFPHLVSQEMNLDICKEPTVEEIKEAVFDLGPTKSPGPDGFAGSFFQNFWGKIGPDFCKEVQVFFETSIMPDGWNDTHIALIPKVQSPESIKQFRPISCCNFRYKVISKILSSRMKKWLPGLVSEMQAAFTGGRLIQDNIIIVHEILHHFKTRRSGNWDMMIKLDMRKAYDLVDWECLDAILLAYGFADKWRGWIRSCVQTVRFSLLMNGSPTEKFQPSRGIRQGDPISPLLFILMSNALSFLIDKAVDKGEIQGIKLNPNCPRISHCLFADDTVIFGKASVKEVDHIQRILMNYGGITGQEINADKSSIFFSKNTPDALKGIITNKLGFSPSICHDKYLGVPSVWGRSKKETFLFLLERMEKKGDSWKSLLLSLGGKEVLLKAVIQAIPTYLMSIFLLPLSLTNKMDSLLKRFFWAGSMKKKSIHRCDARTLEKPKEEGGLGFKNFHLFNVALIGKQVWRILENPDALWVRLLKGLYFGDGDFFSASKGRNGSWIWSGLCDTKEKLKMGLVKSIMSGNDTLFNSDPWLLSAPSFSLSSLGLNQSKVSDWIHQHDRKWKKESLYEVVPEGVVDDILRIPIGPQEAADKWIWKFSNTGAYSVKSAYRALKDNRDLHLQSTSSNDIRPNSEDWKWLWSLSLPPKLRFFIWKIAKGAIATKSRLFDRKCAPSPCCSICNHHVESIHHCFFKCPHASSTWEHLGPSSFLLQEDCSFSDWFFRLKDSFSVDFIKRSVCILWNIWIARNGFLFENKVISPTSSAVLADRDFQAIEEARNFISRPTSLRSATLQSQPRGSRSHPSPPPGSFQRIVHCDGSFCAESREAAYGITIANAHGQVLDGKAEKVFCSYPIQAEAYAILNAVLCASRDVCQTCIRSDCQILILALRRTPDRWPWQCRPILARIISLLQLAPWIKVMFIPRRLNGLADWVARNERLGALPVDWLTVAELVSPLL
ncbi:unnamed protein product [Linum trigynum]